MKREDGDLDGEGEEEGQGEPAEGVGRDGAGGNGLLQGGEVKGVGFGVEPEQGNQQGRRGDEGEEEEAEGSLGAAGVGLGAAVHGNEDGHGDERELPEAVVEHEVEGDEDADHGRLLDQEERVEGLAAVADGVPTGQDTDGAEKAGEDDEPEGEAVHTDVVVDGGAGEPEEVRLKLEAGLTVLEVGGQVQRKEECDDRGSQRDPSRELATVWHEGHKNGADEGGQKNQADDLRIHDQCPTQLK